MRWNVVVEGKEQTVGRPAGVKAQQWAGWRGWCDAEADRVGHGAHKPGRALGVGGWQEAVARAPSQWGPP